MLKSPILELADLSVSKQLAITVIRATGLTTIKTRREP